MIDYTGHGHRDEARFAAAKLIFSKNTRLDMASPKHSLEEIEDAMSDKGIKEQVEYVSKTIPSSWEFIDYTFLVKDVSRAFTHQLVRTRVASFAQQTLRTVRLSDKTSYHKGASVEQSEEAERIFDDQVAAAFECYGRLLEKGVRIEDARGVLPIATKTNILVKMNLRTISEISLKRSSPRVQEEYRQFVRLLISAVKEVHPWAEAFLGEKNINAYEDLRKELEEPKVSEALGQGGRTRVYKAIDRIVGENKEICNG